jgi:hypothetical protein
MLVGYILLPQASLAKNVSASIYLIEKYSLFPNKKSSNHFDPLTNILVLISILTPHKVIYCCIHPFSRSHKHPIKGYNLQMDIREGGIKQRHHSSHCQHFLLTRTKF